MTSWINHLVTSLQRTQWVIDMNIYPGQEMEIPDSSILVYDLVASDTTSFLAFQ